MIPFVVKRRGVQVLLCYDVLAVGASPTQRPPLRGAGQGRCPGLRVHETPPALGLELRRPPKRPLLPPGQSGLGKSTLINTLFKSKISRKSVQQPPSEERIPKTIDIKSITHGECRAGWAGP